jgi:quercetin dioxygenase-like cupin family protein
MGAGHAAGKAQPPRHHAMHRTRSIDYAIVLSGEIDMLLDESEIHLKAGDVLVQQATNHAWVNRGSAPCRIAFVLIDASDPLGD